MRHFLAGTALLPIAMLACRVPEAPFSRRLVARARGPLTRSPGQAGTPPRAVPVTPVTEAADLKLGAAVGTNTLRKSKGFHESPAKDSEGWTGPRTSVSTALTGPRPLRFGPRARSVYLRALTFFCRPWPESFYPQTEIRATVSSPGGKS